MGSRQARLREHEALVLLSFTDEPGLDLRTVDLNYPSVSQEGVDLERLCKKKKKKEQEEEGQQGPIRKAKTNIQRHRLCPRVRLQAKLAMNP